MNRGLVKEKKMAVLEVVKKNKEKLFGSFQNNAVSKVEKEEAWKEVLCKAKSLGLATDERNWMYARDHIFGLWKSRTLAKRDNAQRTGTSGGKTVVLDVVDDAILDIIGSSSAVDKGLGLSGTDGVEAIQPQVAKPKLWRTTTKNKRSKMASLKKKVLESELYKNRLEILKLERDLGLPPSNFTIDLLITGSSDADERNSEKSLVFVSSATEDASTNKEKTDNKS